VRKPWRATYDLWFVDMTTIVRSTAAAHIRSPTQMMPQQSVSARPIQRGPEDHAADARSWRRSVGGP